MITRPAKNATVIHRREAEQALENIFAFSPRLARRESMTVCRDHFSRSAFHIQAGIFPIGFAEVCGLSIRREENRSVAQQILRCSLEREPLIAIGARDLIGADGCEIQHAQNLRGLGEQTEDTSRQEMRSEFHALCRDGSSCCRRACKARCDRHRSRNRDSGSSRNRDPQVVWRDCHPRSALACRSRPRRGREVSCAAGGRRAQGRPSQSLAR